jgi:hypothetical protein
VHLERYDEADAFVVDAGQHRVAGGEGEAVQVVQDRALDRLAGRGHDRHPADRGTAPYPGGPRGHRGVSGRRYVHLDRRHPGGRLPPGTGRRALPLEFPLLFAAESRHRFPHEGVVEDEDEERDGGGDGAEDIIEVEVEGQDEVEGAEDADWADGAAACAVVTSERCHGRPPPARVSSRWTFARGPAPVQLPRPWDAPSTNRAR